MKCVVCKSLFVSLILLLATISLNAQNLMTHNYENSDLFDGNRGDFNEDGIPDVIFATSEGVMVGLSNSQGGLSFLSSVTLSQGDGGALTVAKFTPSGHLDVALIRGGAGSVPNSIDLLLGNGDGTFQIEQPVTLPAGVVPGAIVAADFNGDGKVDLAVSSSNMIYILPGDGDAGFGPAKVITATNTSGDPYGLSGLHVGDFDGDGRPDLILTDPVHTAVMFNNGNFTFQQKDVVSENLQTGPLIADYAAVDVNQDGFTDFIITLQGDCPPNNSPCQGGYAVYLSQGSLRTLKVSYLLPPGQLFTPTRPTVADVNGDGLNDVVLMTPQIEPVLRVALGKPDGTFDFPINFILSKEIGGGTVIPVDLNRDGRPDFVNPGTGGLTTSLNAFPRSACTASTMSPSVTVCQPAADTYSTSPLHVVAKATDTAHTITSMQIYVDGQLKSTTKAANLDTTVALPTGDHLLSVKAWDSSGKNFRSVRRVTIYNGTAGQVCSTASDTLHLCAPAQNASVKSPVRVFAASGTTDLPTSMQVYIDHQLVFNDDVRGDNFIDRPFTLAPGAHSLTVKGWGASGQQLSQSETIHVTQ